MENFAYFGEFAALFTSFLWTVTAMSFEVASKRIGSIPVNLLRLILAFIFLSLFTLITRGMPFPADAGGHAWLWLSISGLIGFVFGDYFLFRAFAMISSRITMLVMTLVPPITALIGWLLLGEIMSPKQVLAMFLVVAGIGLAIVTRGTGQKKYRITYSGKGLMFALLGTIGQAVGLVLSKYGMGEYNAFAATHIRILAGLVGFSFIVIFLKKGHLIRSALKDRKGILATLSGSFFGPFLGVSFSLIAIKYTTTGIAATLMSLMPILLIIPSIKFFKHKVTYPEIIGAFVSVAGVALFFV